MLLCPYLLYGAVQKLRNTNFGHSWPPSSYATKRNVSVTPSPVLRNKPSSCIPPRELKLLKVLHTWLYHTWVRAYWQIKEKTILFIRNATVSVSCDYGLIRWNKCYTTKWNGALWILTLSICRYVTMS